MLISQIKFINMRTIASYSKHAEVSKQYWLSSHAYKVVITPSSYHHIVIMQLIIWCLDVESKPSPMSKGVTEIWINSQPCKGLNLTTWHTQARRAPWVATIHDVTKNPGRVLPRPSAIFHVYASADTPLVAWTLSHCTPVKQGKVSSNSSTHEPTQFGDSICPVCAVHFNCLFIRTPPTRALIDTGRGYHLCVSNLQSRPLSTFPSIILHFPLIATLGLQLCQPFDHPAKPHRTSIDRKGPIGSGFQPLIFYQ
jgi:hypothetical protein